MPKATLTFSLPEEQEEFKLAQNGSLYSVAIYDLDNWLRGLIKYQDIEDIKVEEVRGKLQEILNSLGLAG